MVKIVDRDGEIPECKRILENILTKSLSEEDVRAVVEFPDHGGDVPPLMFSLKIKGNFSKKYNLPFYFHKIAVIFSPNEIYNEDGFNDIAVTLIDKNYMKLVKSFAQEYENSTNRTATITI